MSRRIVLLALLASICGGGGGGGCAGQERGDDGVGRLPLGPRGAADSPLFVHYPDLDHHIVQVDPRSGAAGPPAYPDLWAPLDHVTDFAVDRDHLYLLAGSRQRGALPQLVIADLRALQPPGGPGPTTPPPPAARSVRIARIALAAAPQSLHWTCGGALLVAHGPGPSGPAGLLSVVDLAARRVSRTIPLAGSGASVAPLGEDRALVIERAVREEPGGARGEAQGEVVVLVSLAELDLRAGKVLRRRELPPGARQVIVGPAGLIHVSQASGPGTMATDGTISVLAPRTLRVIRRLRQQMVVRRMVATPRYLVLNMLSGSGDPWVEVQGPDHATVADYNLGELIGSELVVLGDRQVLAPLRRGSSLFRADLVTLGRLARLTIQGGHGRVDRPGLIRTRMSCDAR